MLQDLRPLETLETALKPLALWRESSRVFKRKIDRRNGFIQEATQRIPLITTSYIHYQKLAVVIPTKISFDRLDMCFMNPFKARFVKYLAAVK